VGTNAQEPFTLPILYNNSGVIGTIWTPTDTAEETEVEDTLTVKKIWKKK